jgi:DNA-directed RNA polymerase, mitochondrial
MDQSLWDRQLALEVQAVALGVERYERGRDDESATLPGKTLVYDNIQLVTEAIENWCIAAHMTAGRHHSAVKYLDMIDPVQAAYLSLRVVIQSMGMNDYAQHAAITLSRMIEEHISFTAFAETNGGLYKKIEKQLKRSTSGKHRSGVWGAGMRAAGMKKLKWSTTDRVSLGMKLIELVSESTGFVDMHLQTEGTANTPMLISPTPACFEWMQKAHKDAAEFQPMFAPMVVPPIPWKSPYKGGYISSIGRKRLVKTRNQAYLDELGGIHMPMVYSAVNQVQGTPWRINKAVMDVLQGVHARGETLGGLPPAEPHALPPRPADISTEATIATLTEEQLGRFKAWKAEASKVHEENARLKSKRFALMMTLRVAGQHREDAAVYFPHQLDFRGRMYPMPSFLHPQAEDSAKGMLEFANGLPLGASGGYWLAVHIANLFGVDKVSFDDRVRWVDDNEKAILDSAFEPLDGKRFWDTADKPYQALAACFEWAGYKMQGEAFVSHLPIALDGSCSGLQHFSAMLRDEVGGSAVNLVPSAKPSDVYTTIAEKTQSVIDHSTCAEHAVWQGGKVIRRLIKQCAMTLTYGATRYGMQEQIESALRKLDAEGESHLGSSDHNYEASKALSHVVFETIGTVVVAAQSAMDWLREAAKVATDGKIPVTWTSPCGFPVQQEYKQVIGQTVEVFYQGRRVYLTVVRDGMKLDKRKQASSISPNFVHSLDAAHLMRTVVMCGQEGIDDVCVIHDSFATHAANTDELATLLRTAFIEQYTPDVLGAFRDQLGAQLSEELADSLPSLPEMGTLDLARVAESDFFFA